MLEDESFIKKETSTIKDVLNNYRNLVLVDQAEIDKGINQKIINEIEEKLIEEYGSDFSARKLDTIERTAIQIFNAV